MDSRDREVRRKQERGAFAVEFALVAMIFFTVLLGIIELGRFMYLWNSVQEVTRRAAREAVVRDFTAAEIGAIQRDAIFRSGSSGTVGLPGGGELTNLRIDIQYLNGLGNPAAPMPNDPADNQAACADASRQNTCIQYVQARVCASGEEGCPSVQYVPMVGLFPFLAIDIPESTVTMPAESLGYRP
jgi:hypothetical protein